MKVLVTGGIGYIGSHTVVEMSKNNDYDIVILDNLINSNIEIKNNIEKIISKRVKFYKTDLLEIDELREIFRKENFDLVIHFAALKSVSESVSEPLKYYNNNLTGTINLLMVIKVFNVKNITIMIIHIRHMVSQRCKMTVIQVLNKMGLTLFTVDLGVVILWDNITKMQISQIGSALHESGLELIEDKKDILIEQIKIAAIESIYYSSTRLNVPFSTYLKDKLNLNYNYLSNMFTRSDRKSVV